MAKKICFAALALAVLLGNIYLFSKLGVWYFVIFH